jgi:hypothetical protein
MIEAIDTHYVAVKKRILQLNPDRQILGVMDAQDWPEQKVVNEALYLVTLGESPLGKSADSAAIPVVVHTVQWTWMIFGTDVQAGINLRSRGDKYRKHYQIIKELEYGLFPRYTQKCSVAPNADGTDLVATPLTDPIEYILWNSPTITKRIDKPSGLLYGIASVRITNMSDVIQAS